MMTDPIADFLTRIRNGARARHGQVQIPWSRLTERIARVMHDEGFLGEIATEDEGYRKRLRITLRYNDQRASVITGVARVSKPSLRVYVGCEEIPMVRHGLGISILSTPMGVLVDRDARRQRVGGEILCSVW
jgi:small subunit ribosomal protein S8